MDQMSLELRPGPCKMLKIQFPSASTLQFWPKPSKNTFYIVCFLNFRWLGTVATLDGLAQWPYDRFEFSIRRFIANLGNDSRGGSATQGYYSLLTLTRKWAGYDMSRKVS